MHYTKADLTLLSDTPKSCCRDANVLLCVECFRLKRPYAISIPANFALQFKQCFSLNPSLYILLNALSTQKMFQPCFTEVHVTKLMNA